MDALETGVKVMKKIEVIISPEAADAVTELLNRRHISNFSLSSVMAKDSRGAHIQTYRGHAYAVAMSPEVKVEAVLEDAQATATAHAILDAARESEGSLNSRVIITPVTEVILEIGRANSKSSSDSQVRPDGVAEPTRPDTTPADVPGNAQAPALPRPPRLVHRITTVLLAHFKRLTTTGVRNDAYQAVR